MTSRVAWAWRRRLASPGLAGARLAASGVGLLLLARIKSTDKRTRMPPLARNIVDPEGAALIEAWIASMP